MLQDSPRTGQKLVETYCTVCHNLDYVEMQPHLTQEQAQKLWANTVRKMMQSYGAKIPDRATKQLIIDYLVSQSTSLSARSPGLAEEAAGTAHRRTNSSPQ